VTPPTKQKTLTAVVQAIRIDAMTSPPKKTLKEQFEELSKERLEKSSDWLLHLRNAHSILTPEERDLLVRYYQGERSIRARKALAEELGISISALRIRGHRLRRRVEQHMARYPA
jgi:DNA-directed RNA polymerase specialized sigma24 family protein